jgi:glycosyltransferase involved in cell wall biosynthesis
MSIVTAVIPCHNAAPFLREAIDSVKGQSMVVAETLVIDDGSVDASAAIAREAGVQVLSTGGWRGPGAARNVGARHAKTPYLAFLDADDQWLPRHCETVLALLEAAPAAAVAFGEVQRFEGGREVPAPGRRGPRKGTLPELLSENPIAQSAAAVDRAKLLAAGGYREDLRYAEDYDLWLRLADHFPFVRTEQITCRYRIHPAQLSHDTPAMIRGGWEARMACRRRLEARGAFTAEHHRMMLLALEDDLRTAWLSADAQALELLLELSNRVEAGPTLRRAIHTRIRWLPARRLLCAIRALGNNTRRV